MKKLPEKIPSYIITQSSKKTFDVKCEELQGLSIIPRLGEETVWGLYDAPTGKCSEYSRVKVTGKAEVHSIEGVEIISTQHLLKSGSIIERQFIAQLTDSHCRYLAETHMERDIKKFITFLDGDIFMKNWGFGDCNCGNETSLSSKNIIRRNGNAIIKSTKKEAMDIVGRYTVEIAGKTYDTVCVMWLGRFDNAIAIEQYIDKNGRTVLWRRFNRDDWAIKRYKKKWSEQLPDNEKITINKELFVHWYDCITDYIL